MRKQSSIDQCQADGSGFPVARIIALLLIGVAFFHHYLDGLLAMRTSEESGLYFKRLFSEHSYITVFGSNSSQKFLTALPKSHLEQKIFIVAHQENHMTRASVFASPGSGVRDRFLNLTRLTVNLS